MSKLIIVCTFLFSSVFLSSCSSDVAEEASIKLKVMTFNIRNGRAKDGVNHWDLRKEFVADVIRGYSPDVLGVQEAYHFQLKFFDKTLPGYEQVGIGRDGGEKGEYSAVL